MRALILALGVRGLVLALGGRGLVLALGFLTRLPVPHVSPRPGDLAAAVRLYPLAGIAVGGAVAAAAWAGAHVDPWVGALAALVAWVAVTGALHLDGLADLADGLGAAHGDRGRLLAVMADPHVGGFGATAIALQIAAKLVLLHAIVAAGPVWPLVALPAAARLGPLLWSRALPPLKPGLAAGIAGAVRRRDLAGWAALLAGAAVAVPALLACAALLPLWAAWLRRRIGGVTGDAHGAGIEVVESGLLLALAAAPRPF